MDRNFARAEGPAGAPRSGRCVCVFPSAPADILSNIPRPDLAEQQRIASLALDYLNETIPKLTDFFARRTTVRYEETPQFSK